MKILEVQSFGSKSPTTLQYGENEEQLKSKTEKSEQGAGEQNIGETSKIRILL
jgi:hypothetical protein